VSTAATDRSWRHDPRWRRRLTDYERNRYQQKRSGSWAPFAATGPVREHLEHLYGCGMTQAEISRAAGVSVTAMYRATKAARMSTAAAQALLAVQPIQNTERRQAVAGTPVVVAQRQAELASQALQALVADGWTLLQLAVATGLNTRTIGRTVHGHTAPLPATAAVISDVHDVLFYRDPGNTAAATASRLRAARAGWQPSTPRPDDDDIDSVAVHRAVQGDLVPLRSAERQIVLHQLAGKHPDHEISHRLGISSRTVHRHRTSQGLPAYGSPRQADPPSR